MGWRGRLGADHEVTFAVARVDRHGRVATLLAYCAATTHSATHRHWLHVELLGSLPFLSGELVNLLRTAGRNRRCSYPWKCRGATARSVWIKDRK
jgi:hypothetical protein